MGLSLPLFRGRKGIFFTLIAVSLLAIILFSYTSTYSYSLQEKASLVGSRVETMNSFLKEIDSDMSNAIYISSYRALISLEDYVANEGVFVDDTASAFEELFMNGTMDGVEAAMMANNTFLYWMDRITEEAGGVGINFSLAVGDVSIYHVSPWTVRVGVDAQINVSDIKATASWTQDREVYSDISIIGFEDPWYAVYSNGNLLKRINMTVYEGNYTDAQTNTTNIRDHVEKTLYAAFNASPSFLMRFAGDFDSSEFGIESMVDKSEVGAYKPCPAETSSVDSIYWLCDSSVQVWQVANWSGFRIDNSSSLNASQRRLEKYMMEDYIIK